MSASRPLLLLALLPAASTLGAQAAPAAPAAPSAALACTPAAPDLGGANAVAYQVAFPNAAHHEAEVAVTVAGLPADRPLELRMSRTSPGRYALHEFAKNVYAVRATDSRGRELAVARPDPHQWDVAGHDGTVRVTYTIFGDRADGTYLAVDRTHAHMNVPATFMFARGLGDRPVRLTVCAPDPSWTVATQLAPTSDPRTFTAPHFQYFMDSPVEASAHETHEWPVTSGGRTQTIRVALHHQGSAEDAARYVDMTRKVVAEQAAVFGELPEFDFGTYTFIADYLPWADGDGMEHRNSTILTSSGALAGSGALQLLGTVSHEFFHAWNVERIRPASLEPFDFEAANMSGELWLAEGFTSYYGPLTIHRAGLTTAGDYARTAGASANAVLNAPGRRWFSPVEMSRQAPFVDAATSVDPHNRANTFFSYYTWGAGLGLALDLELRARGRTLDDYMRALWTEFGRAQRDQAPVRPYTMDDARRVLGQVAGDAAWAAGWFARFVTGREAPDFAALLAPAGILLRPAQPEAAWLGDAQWRAADGELRLASRAIVGTPLHEAGLEQGDRLVSLGGRPVAAPADVAAALAERRPGDPLAVVFESRGATHEATLTLAANPRLEGVLFEEAGRPVTEEIRRFRAAWLGSGVRR